MLFLQYSEHIKSYCYLGFGKKGVFTTASLHRELKSTGMTDREVMSIWKTTIPMKVWFFLWSIYSDCLPSAEQLIKRNWPGEELCKLCGRIEMAQHIFFECFLATYCWWFFREALNWNQTPTSLTQFLLFSRDKSNSPKPLMIYILACICWSH